MHACSFFMSESEKYFDISAGGHDPTSEPESQPGVSQGGSRPAPTFSFFINFSTASECLLIFLFVCIIVFWSYVKFLLKSLIFQ